MTITELRERLVMQDLRDSTKFSLLSKGRHIYHFLNFYYTKCMEIADAISTASFKHKIRSACRESGGVI